jgi:hypothetical protein
MLKLEKLFVTEDRAGKPIEVGGKFIVPIEKVTKIQPPNMSGVGLWRRPSAVVIEHPDGTDEVIEIQDPTRQAVLTLLGFGIIGSVLIWLISKTFQR